MLRRADRLEANEGHLHTSKRTNRVPRRVCHVETAAVAAHEHEHKGMHGNHVRDERISTPCCDHVEVENGGDGAIKSASLLKSFYPTVEREHEQEDGDSFVVV